MTRAATISDRLFAAADALDATDPAVAQLRAMAKKLDSFQHGPKDRKQGERIAPLLTPAVVGALGRALVDVRSEEIEVVDPTAWDRPEFKEANYAWVGVLAAAQSQDPTLAAAGSQALAELIELIPRLPAQQLVSMRRFSTTDSAADHAVREAFQARLEVLGPTQAQLWAESMGLPLPRESWTLRLVLKGPGRADRDPAAPWWDADVEAIVESVLGETSEWSLKIGRSAPDSLGSSKAHLRLAGPPVGTFKRKDLVTGDVLEGFVEPAKDPTQYPRVLAELRARYPQLGLAAMGPPQVFIGPVKVKSAALKEATAVLSEWLMHSADTSGAAQDGA